MSGKNEKVERLIQRVKDAEGAEEVLRRILSLPENRREDLFLWSRELLARFKAEHDHYVRILPPSVAGTAKEGPCALCLAYQDFLKEANR